MKAEYKAGRLEDDLTVGKKVRRYGRKMQEGL